MSAFRRNVRVEVMAGAAAASSLLWHAAVAQAVEEPAAGALAAQAAADNNQSSSAVIGEIIVTARKREETLQRVPLAVSAQTGESLERSQITDLYSLSSVAPSFKTQSSTTRTGATRFSIRGIGTAVTGPQVEASVGVVIDEVPITRPELAIVEFFDIDRVEILRGPQGMLFGKNAAAGLINIVTAQPQLNDTELLVSAQYGYADTSTSYKGRSVGDGHRPRINVAANIPVSDNSALRLSGYYFHDSAHMENVANPTGLGLDMGGARLKYLWEPTGSLKFVLAGDYTHGEGPSDAVTVPRFEAPTGALADINAQAGVTASKKNVLMSANMPSDAKFENGGVSLITTADLPRDFSLTGVVGYREANGSQQSDVDLTFADILESSVEYDRSQVTAELRLTSPSDGRLTYQAGLFYLNLDADDVYLIEGNANQPIPAPLRAIGTVIDVSSSNESKAVFFEGQYKILDSLRFTAGGRYTWDDFDFLVDQYKIPNAIMSTGPDHRLPKSADEENLSYRFSLDYDLAQDVMAYFTYARGYKGPTFDQLTGAFVKPEIPTDYELGVKSILFDRKLLLNVGLFHEVFKGFQTQVLRADSGISAPITVNAGRLKSSGVEVEFQALPWTGLSISGGVTYNDTEYEGLSGLPCYFGQPQGTSGTNVCLPNGSQDVSGNQLALAPRWAGSLVVRYERPVASGWTGFMQADAYAVSAFNFFPYKDPHTRLDASETFGMSIGAETDNNRWAVSLFVRNLTDERVPSYVLPNNAASLVGDHLLGGDYIQQFNSQSFRLIGLSVRYRM